MPTRGGVARISARAIVGVVGVAVAAVTIAGAALLPLPHRAVTPPASTVSPVATDQQRVCAGPLLALAADSTAATAASAFGRVTVISGTSQGGPIPQTSALNAVDDTEAGRFGAPRTVTVPAEPGATQPPELAASQLQQASLPDLSGLAASSCDEAASESWLVGGATNLGQTSLVLLSNPSSVQATVNLTIYGESGIVDAPAATGIVVPAGTQHVVPLAGLAPSVTAPVVHVQAIGGRVLASMQQSFVTGLEPGGAELEGPTTTPSTHQVIAGVTVRSLATLQASQSGEGYGPDLPAARIFVPGNKAATVRIGVVGETGTIAGNSISATVQPGVVTEVPLDHLADGDFTVMIDATQPVVAAARTSIVGTAAKDFAWFVASPPLNGSFLAAVAAGPGATLHLANDSEKDVTATVTNPSGVASKVTVPAQGGVGVAAPAAGIYRVESGNPVTASVSYVGDGLMTSFAINPPGPLATSVTVYPK
ncbi:MAG: hypothetical protein QOF36_1203 [Microbacteriaceae bacterium]|nr:hypothetical protein [Microbacteriaceae bacterium]